MATVYADLLTAQPAMLPPDNIPRENIAFVRRHEDHIAKLLASLNRD